MKKFLGAFVSIFFLSFLPGGNWNCFVYIFYNNSFFSFSISFFHISCGYPWHLQVNFLNFFFKTSSSGYFRKQKNEPGYFYTMTLFEYIFVCFCCPNCSVQCIDVCLSELLYVLKLAVTKSQGRSRPNEMSRKVVIIIFLTSDYH